MRSLTEEMKNKVLLYDGSKGVMLQLKGLSGGNSAEEWNILHPDAVNEIYQSYINAGADIIQTNTFCANRPSLKSHGLENKIYQINTEGAKLALKAAEKSETLVAASIGPTGEFLEPAGDMTFEQAVEYYKEQIQPIADAGVRIVNFETFTDLSEMRAAVIAAKEIGGLQILCSFSFDGERTMSGNTPEVCSITCAALGAAAVGANCSGGPESLIAPIEKMAECTDIPLCVKPNAGLPEMEDGCAVFKQKPEDFAKMTAQFIKSGVRLIGGCCGTGPDHIRAMRSAVDAAQCPEIPRNVPQRICSAQQTAQNIEHLAVLDADTEEMREVLHTGDFYSVADNLPDNLAEADAVLLDFGQSEPDFDMCAFVNALCMFVKKPVLVKGKKETAQLFLRFYPGRAGIAVSENVELPDEMYGALAFDLSALLII